MIQPNNQPKLVIFAGPNGSGKSTITATFKESAGFPSNYINPDDIARDLTENDPTRRAYQAATIAESQRQSYGLFDDIQGLRSALAFAPSEKDNGLLTAEEILDQKLNADLVVLSACDTGRGSITGDGVIGLSRSLISAGTPSVIVSLWAVPDAPTSELMKEFYTNMFEKKLDKAQALRQAMLKFKDKPPKNWAAFTLIGEPE